MVCLFCLLPLFLLPIINLLPILFDFILGKVYRLFGWEYRKPVRVAPACPYKPAANKSTSSVVAELEPGASEPVHKLVRGVDGSKLD